MDVGAACVAFFGLCCWYLVFLFGILVLQVLNQKLAFDFLIEG